MHTVLFWILTNPLAVLLLLLGLGVANLWRRRRALHLGFRPLLAVTVPFVLLVLSSTPAFIFAMRGVLEWPYPPAEGRPEGVEAIVVLGSRVDPDAEVPGHFVLDEHALSRCRRAVDLYRTGEPCPVLVSGGPAAADEPACAAAMRDYLLRQGVASSDVLVEDRSGDTYENAVECRRLLDEHGLHRVALVTDGSHLARAVGCFRKQGVEAVPCGCNYLSTPGNRGRLMFTPHPRALQTAPAVCYEWLALVWYWVRCKI
jgi:uncharacterized SAM-binding protein YcdF (DUF218 family)